MTVWRGTREKHSWVCGVLCRMVFLVWFLCLIKCKWKLTVYGGKNAGLQGFRNCQSCQNQCVNTWAYVRLNFGSFSCAESTPSSAEAELQVLLALKGRWAPCAQPGNCGSSPCSSCWQMLACLYRHPCLQYTGRLFCFLPFLLCRH